MYKFIILIAILFCVSTMAKAQTQQGNQLLGGYVRLSLANSSSTGASTTYLYTNGYTSDAHTYGFGPSYSYFVADNLDLGATVGYARSKQEFSNLPYGAPYVLSSYESKSFGSSVYLRKYFLFAEKIGFRTGPFVSFYYADQTDSYTSAPNQATSDHTLSAGLNLDLVYFPTRRLGFATSLGSLAYTHDIYNQDGNRINTNNLGLSFITSGLTASAFYVFGK